MRSILSNYLFTVYGLLHLKNNRNLFQSNTNIYVSFWNICTLGSYCNLNIVLLKKMDVTLTLLNATTLYNRAVELYFLNTTKNYIDLVLLSANTQLTLDFLHTHCHTLGASSESSQHHLCNMKKCIFLLSSLHYT